MGHLTLSESVTTAVLDKWVRSFAALVAENREHLTELDAAIGDADHGSNMDRGMTAAVAALDETRPASAGALLSKVGMTLVSTVGGASGPLFGTLFLRMGTSLGDTGTVSATDLAAALRAGLGGVVDRGKAGAGDKTMYDALAPAVGRARRGARGRRTPVGRAGSREGRRRRGSRRDHPDAGAQGSGQLSGGAQRRAPGPRCDDGGAAARGRDPSLPAMTAGGSAQEVGLVVVSHSRALAEAAVVLAEEMLHGRSLRIEVAAGLDETTLGTDAVSISAAIERADGPGGVVVLMDLGSALLSAELALDLLNDPTARDRVTLSPAPIVEGLVVAAVAAAGGASRAEVAAEARDALMGKAAHLAVPTTDVVEPPRLEEVVGVFTVENPHGLHARPAARLVSEVRTLDASVQLRNLTTGVGPVPAASLSRVATLGAVRGHEVEVRASGPQAQEAVEHLLTLATRRFDETDEDVVEVTALGSGRPAECRRTAAGVTGHRDRPGPKAHRRSGRGRPGAAPVEPAAEWRRVVEAVATARREIEHARVLTAREVGASQAGIFDAHLLLLSDAEMLAEVKSRLAGGAGAVAAWTGCLAEVEAQWAELPDPYLRQRAADVRAVGEQVLRALTGQTERRMTDSGVLVAARPDPGGDRGAGPGPGDGRDPGGRQPHLPRRDPGPGPGHPGHRVRRPRRAGADRRHHRRRRRKHRRAARRAVGGPARRVSAAGQRGGRAQRSTARPRWAAGHLARRHGVHRGRQPGLGRRRPRGARRRCRRCRAGPDRVHLPRPVGGADRRGAAGGLRRDRGGDGRTAGHAAHPRRRRRQAAVVPADARRGQPVPRAARHQAEPRSPRAAARPAGRHVRDRATVPDRHHVPDGDHPR